MPRRRRPGAPYKERDKVQVVEELPGVPVGTRGKVLMVTGLTWIRYRVKFANGVELNLIDGHYLEPASRKASPPAAV
jgi:hypothetical protein